MNNKICDQSQHLIVDLVVQVVSAVVVLKFYKHNVWADLSFFPYLAP